MKIHKLFTTVFINIHRVKPVLLAEAILLTSTLLMGVLPGDTGRACCLSYNLMICCSESVDRTRENYDIIEQVVKPAGKKAKKHA